MPKEVNEEVKSEHFFIDYSVYGKGEKRIKKSADETFLDLIR